MSGVFHKHPPQNIDLTGLARALKRLRPIRFLPWLGLALMLAITYQLWDAEQHNADQDLQDEFNLKVQETSDRIKQRMLGYEQMLRGVSGLFTASGAVTRNGFREYVSSLRLEKNYPGIQGVGFLPLITPDQKAKHIAAVRREGFPEYTIKPEGERDIYTPITYLEPLSGRNLRAFGFDRYSELTRRRGMDQARDLNEAVISGKVKLVIETNQNPQAGFLMNIPVYKNGMPHETLADRRANSIGWVTATFRMCDLMAGMLGKLGSSLDIEVFDGEKVAEEALMHDSDNVLSIGHPSSRYQVSSVIQVAGRPWTVVMRSLPEFDVRLDRKKPLAIATFGVAASLLLFLFIWLLVFSREQAMRMASKLVESETRLKELFEHMPSGVAIYRSSLGGDDFVFTAFNRAAERIENMHREDVIGKNITETFPGVMEFGLLDVFRRVWQSGVAEHFPLAFYKDGHISGWRENYVYKLPGDEIVAIYDDVTERKQNEEKIRISEARLQATLDNSPYMIWQKDTDGRYIAFNQPFIRMLGQKQPHDVLGKTDFDLWPNELAEKYRADDAEVMHSRKQTVVEEHAVNDGKIYWVETCKTPIVDKNGEVLGTTGFAQDITGRKAAEERIRYLAHYDALTDLPNRALFNDRLQQALATAMRNKTRMALMFIDLDEFKPVNDMYGHAVGDLLLKEAAKRMRDCLRESDTVARMGGDEFIVLLPTIEAEQDARVAAEKIRLALNQSFELAGENLRISSSIGIAIYPEHGSEEKALLKNADTAMYYAKESGRNTVRVFPTVKQESN